VQADSKINPKTMETFPHPFNEESLKLASGMDTLLSVARAHVTPTNDFAPFLAEDIEQSVPARFEQQVAKYPNRLAVQTRTCRFTYAQLNEAANSIAHAILDQLGEGEEPVAILLDQDATAIAAIMGVLKAGKIYVPIDPLFPRARLAYMMEDAGASLIVTSSRHLALTEELASREVPVINVDGLKTAGACANPEVEIAPDRGFHILYTSGSTGQPKGVLQNHRNLLFEVLRVTNSFHVCPEDRLALLHSCSFSASLRRIFPALLNGASLHPLDIKAEGLRDLPEWFVQQEITISNGRRLLRDCAHALTGEDQFPSLRLVTFGGEPTYRSDVELYKKYLAPLCLMLINLATTETGSDRHFFIDKRTEIKDGLPPLGYATEGTEILLLDEDGREVGPNQIGEIAVKSRYLSPGYWRKPELTAKRFLPDPAGGEARIYLTGDLGHMDADGCLFYGGRKDFQIKVRGYRIEAAEVEAALLNMGVFTEAVVTAHDDSLGEKQLIAYLLTSGRHTPGVGDLRRALAETLPDYMIPSLFVMLEEFPRTPTGKVDRKALPPPESTPSAQGELPDTDAAPRDEFGNAPGDGLEQQLIGVCKKLLNLERVGVHDDFFELGGHSLLAVRLFAEIEQLTGRKLPLATLFQAPTVNKLAGLLRREGWTSSWSSLVAIQPEGSKPPFYCVHGLGGNVLCYRDLARHLGPDQPVYGLQAEGLDRETGRPISYTGIEHMATHYIQSIRTLQPSGPYFLSGLSFGGRVAFAMAQQLQAQGKQVALLAMFDTFGPDVKFKRIGPRISAHLNAFGSLQPKEKLVYVRDRFDKRFRSATQRIKSTTQSIQKISNLSARDRKHHRLSRKSDSGEENGGSDEHADRTDVWQIACSSGQPYPGRTILFRAQQRTMGIFYDDNRMGWDGIADNLSICEVPGDHTSLIEKPHVQVLAQRLRAYLDEAQALVASQREATRQHRPAQPGVEFDKNEPDKQQLVATVSDEFIELLNSYAVEHIFINPGTDTAPILESIAKFKNQGRRTPELILCLHESVAMAAAHGHFMVSGRPQVLMVHVDVGTQNIGANLHNAQRGRAGVIICAGRAPYTIDGTLAGGRNRYTHWLQEQPDQASIVRNYVKWHYELTCRDNLYLAVQRAFQVASSQPVGPVYLILPREVLMQEVEAPASGPQHSPGISAPAANIESLSQAAQWLIEAENPLILVAYAGRNPQAVAPLVRLAESLAAPVVESRHRVNFPSSHPLHMGFSTAGYLQQADCILILDNDVPWVPEQGQPSPQCRIIHVDTDPLKCNIPIWGFPVDLSIQADSSQAMAALAEEVERRLKPADRTRIERRRPVVAAEHQRQRAGWRQRALDLAVRQPIAPEWAAYCLNEIVDEHTLIVGEAVTNNSVLWNYLQLDAPGTYYQSLGSGLGWGLGAALGAKLAAPSKSIICVVGDGSWMFGSPIVAYCAAQQYSSPFLTVIFNNQEYSATSDAILSVAPDGYARKTGSYPVCDLPKPPLYSKIAAAMGLWAVTVDDPAKLPAVLREALSQVRQGRAALVDICVSSPRLLERTTPERAAPDGINTPSNSV
jgi:amino acid adenylation domain-containing protein